MKIDRTANIANGKDELYCQDKENRMEKSRIVTEGSFKESDIKLVLEEMNIISSVFDMESFNKVKSMLLEVIDSLTVSHVNISEVVEEIINLSKIVHEDDLLV